MNSTRKRTGSLVVMSLAFIMALSVLAYASTGNAQSSTTTGDGAGRTAYLAHADFHCNVSAPSYAGLDLSEWNLSANGTYLGAGADITIIVWINDGVENFTNYIMENETLATNDSIDAYVSIDPDDYAMNESAVITIAIFLDQGAEAYDIADSADNWTGAISIEDSAILAALRYFMPAMITLCVVGVILSQIQKIIPR